MAHSKKSQKQTAYHRNRLLQSYCGDRLLKYCHWTLGQRLIQTASSVQTAAQPAFWEWVLAGNKG